MCKAYPNQLYFAKSLQAFSLDYRFPILNILRGIGTLPAFANYLYGFTFAELNYFPNAEPGANLLTSAGGGLRLQSKLLLQVPMTLSMEYHQGFEKVAGGAGEFLFFLGVGTNGL